MPAIHLIERNDDFKRPDKTSNTWESGNWALSEDTIHSLVGGEIYFHKGQLEPSFFGGIITGYRFIQEPNPSAGRVIIIFETDPKMKGIRTDREGWGNEKKIVP
jgi:hypothetical protein